MVCHLTVIRYTVDELLIHLEHNFLRRENPRSSITRLAKQLRADCLAEIHHVVTYEEERKHRSTIIFISRYIRRGMWDWLDGLWLTKCLHVYIYGDHGWSIIFERNASRLFGWNPSCFNLGGRKKTSITINVISWYIRRGMWGRLDDLWLT